MHEKSPGFSAAGLARRRSSLLATAVCWLVLIASGASLALCAFLPAWLEYRAAQQIALQRKLVFEQVRQRMELLDRQLEHLRDDPAYIERVAREESRAEAPGIETIYVQSAGGERGAQRQFARQTAELGAENELTGKIDRLVNETPWMELFISPPTRPAVLVLSAGVFLIAIFLLAAQPRPSAHAAAD